jgi:hypothetical protein
MDLHQAIPTGDAACGLALLAKPQAAQPFFV